MASIDRQSEDYSAEWPEKGAPNKRQFSRPGFTLIELLIVVAIIATLAGIAMPLFSEYTTRAKYARAIHEIKILETEVLGYEIDHGHLPKDLGDIDRSSLQDPWGNPYRYTNFALAPKGKWRKDKFLVPLNSGFDLWSAGPDGDSKPPLTAKASQDDVIRANDGGFIGKASLY